MRTWNPQPLIRAPIRPSYCETLCRVCLRNREPHPRPILAIFGGLCNPNSPPSRTRIVIVEKQTSCQHSFELFPSCFPQIFLASSLDTKPLSKPRAIPPTSRYRPAYPSNSPPTIPSHYRASLCRALCYGDRHQRLSILGPRLAYTLGMMRQGFCLGSNISCLQTALDNNGSIS